MQGLHTLLQDISVTAFWKGQGEGFDLERLVTVEDGNRWNAPGEPTVYLTGDPGLALVEAGRHAEAGSAGASIEGVVWSVHVDVGEVLDLRRPEAREMLGLADGYWFLEKKGCHSLTRRLRDSGLCQGIMAQSAGLPDVPGRWNLVLFVDRLVRPLEEVVTDARRLGSYRLATVDAGEVPTQP